MAKVLKCRDVGSECDFEVRAETIEEVLRLAGRHAAERHGMTEISEEKLAEIKALIREAQ